MRHAETVTFGGSALDRAGELRGNAAALEQLRADPKARAIVRLVYTSDAADALLCL